MQMDRAFRAGLALFLCLGFSSLEAKARDEFMPIGTPTSVPIGSISFCRDHPADCRPDAGGAGKPFVLSPEIVREVARINMAANAEIRPATDREIYGVEERWTYPGPRGDCEDYALLKRKRLHALGIPMSDLLMTVVRKRNGEGHAVLTLRSGDGDFVLDNLDWRVRPWAETPYTFVKRQSSADPQNWLAIRDDADVAVGAVGR